MNRTKKHKVNVLLALFLATVLIGSILIKPAHILLVHHDRTKIIQLHTNQKSISNLRHQDCAICDFEFCSFIPQKQVIVLQVNIIINELASRMVACFVCKTFHNFQLRAPPVF